MTTCQMQGRGCVTGSRQAEVPGSRGGQGSSHREATPGRAHPRKGEPGAAPGTPRRGGRAVGDSWTGAGGPRPVRAGHGHEQGRPSPSRAAKRHRSRDLAARGCTCPSRVRRWPRAALGSSPGSQEGLPETAGRGDAPPCAPVRLACRRRPRRPGCGPPPSWGLSAPRYLCVPPGEPPEGLGCRYHLLRSPAGSLVTFMTPPWEEEGWMNGWMNE